MGKRRGEVLRAAIVEMARVDELGGIAQRACSEVDERETPRPQFGGDTQVGRGRRIAGRHVEHVAIEQRRKDDGDVDIAFAQQIEAAIEDRRCAPDRADSSIRPPAA